MMRIISSLSSESNLVDLNALLMSLSSSIICKIGFGKGYKADDEKSNEFSTSRFQGLLHDTQAILTAFFFSDYLPYMGWIDKINGALSKLERVFRQLDEFYEEIISTHLDSHKEKPEQQQDIIDVLLQLREENKVPFDLTLDHIKGVLMKSRVLNFRLSDVGTDTSAATVVWAMTELMKNPNVMKKVQEEVRNLVKEQVCSATIIQEEQLHHLIYLKAVVKETFRLHPPSPLLVPRQTMQECTLEGYQIEQGTLVFINAWAIGRDPESWDNPETFLPERFLGSPNPVDYKGQDFELIPFGAGRRGCPGMVLGVTTIELALANLLCFFDWELPASMKREDIDMDNLPGITAHKKKALCLSATNLLGLQ
uniref:Cytochrome P450 n=1 Tax=Chenopodium quinoa TaxID=63459 RepID=A0A803LKA5_CHEQI